MPIVTIESLDHEGRGVAHADGKVLFIDGGLPGECVKYQSFRRKPNYELAQAIRILRPSAQRVEPRCQHFGVCGGCSQQHLLIAGQTAAKQRVLEDAFKHLANLKPEEVWAPITGPAWGYRHRARLSVRHVLKKGGVLVGFHEKRSSYIAVMDACPILPPAVSTLIPPLRQMIAGLSIVERLPQIEVSVGHEQIVLVLRVLESPSQADETALRDFADRHELTLWLQPAGPDSAQLFYPLDAPPLEYRLPDYGLRLFFRPTEFTQVNHGINRLLVRRAMALLDPQPGERIADMFCGLGNFTLPIATLGATVVGFEGGAALVARAQANAVANDLAAACQFGVTNLFEVSPESLDAWGRFDKMLIDPPREGALALVKALDEKAPKRIVYVSCNPATLARDAAILVHEKGYRLAGAGIATMFPHTSHVESIALFER